MFENKENPIEWLNTNYPDATTVDVDFTMEKYNFPEFVKEYIKKFWIKIDEKNGGTYKKPTTDLELNKKGIEIVLNKSSDDSIAYLLTNPKTGATMSYAESRMLYG
tara:strand:+ start:3181 stop:3498 length:318 start_codon:yes stop_codon:yes gene_type:complete